MWKFHYARLFGNILRHARQESLDEIPLCTFIKDCTFIRETRVNSFEHSTQLTLVRVISCVSINYCLKKMICRIGHIEGLLSFCKHLLLWILNLPLAENGFWHWPHTWSFYPWWPRRFDQRPPDSPFRVSEQILTSFTTSKNSSLYDFLVHLTASEAGLIWPKG